MVTSGRFSTSEQIIHPCLKADTLSFDFYCRQLGSAGRDWDSRLGVKRNGKKTTHILHRHHQNYTVTTRTKLASPEWFLHCQVRQGCEFVSQTGRQSHGTRTYEDRVAKAGSSLGSCACQPSLVVLLGQTSSQPPATESEDCLVHFTDNWRVILPNSQLFTVIWNRTGPRMLRINKRSPWHLTGLTCPERDTHKRPELPVITNTWHVSN